MAILTDFITVWPQTFSLSSYCGNMEKIFLPKWEIILAEAVSLYSIS